MAATRSSAWPLAWLFAALIVYASLHPFTGWTWPAEPDPRTLVALPWTHYHYRFDLVSNFAGYLPLGVLFCLAWLRSGRHPAPSVLSTALLAGGLSYCMEALQHLLPGRVPSRLDWVLNTAGSYAGALLAVLIQDLGWVDRLRARRDRWWLPDSGNGQALLLLWPIGLLFPPPVPLGLGQVLDRVIDLMGAALEQTPWEEWAPAARDWRAPLAPASEMLTITLGLLAPVIVAFVITRRPWPRLVLMLGAALLGAGITTLSTTLNFGPAHAWAWATPAVLPGFVLAGLVGALLAWLPTRLIAGIGLVALTASIAFVNEAPVDPYFALSLQGWEQGRFIRFHGLAQWVGWLWPYAALCWLLARVSRPPPREPRDDASQAPTADIQAPQN